MRVLYELGGSVNLECHSVGVKLAGASDNVDQDVHRDTIKKIHLDQNIQRALQWDLWHVRE